MGYIGEMKWFMWFIERINIKEFKSSLNLLPVYIKLL